VENKPGSKDDRKPQRKSHPRTEKREPSLKKKYKAQYLGPGRMRFQLVPAGVMSKEEKNALTT